MKQTYTFSPVTATDRAGLVWVASILSLMFTVLTLATRFFIKLHTLGSDDWFIAGATLLGLGQYITIYIGLDQGVGISSTILEKSHAQRLGAYVLTTEILTILALTLSKVSIIYFMKRLFTREHKNAWLALHILLGTTIAWGVGSVLLVSIGCPTSTILYGADRCTGLVARWATMVSIDGALEIVYVALVVILVRPLQMTLYIKATVVFAFAFRLVCTLFAALRGIWGVQYAHSPDPGLAIANLLVWQQAQLGYALIASTIPTLKSFVRGYHKAMGWEASYQEKRGLGGGYNLGSYGLRSAENSGNRSKASHSRPEGSVGGDDGLRVHGAGGYHAGAYHDNTNKVRRMASTASVNSQDPIIRRDVLVTVEHEQIGPAT